jgi:hypothetical protein
VFLSFRFVILSFFSSRGWESWDIANRPLIPERMPVLVDDDLLFEDGPAAPRPPAVVNRWLRELPSSGCPSPGSWESYARVLKEWAEFLALLGVGLFDSRDQLKLALGKYAEYRAAGPAERRFAATTWGRHVSVLSLFYRWALEEGHAQAEPFTYRMARALFAGTGRVARVNLAVRRTPKPHVTIKYLEPDFTRLFLNGLRGLAPGGDARLVREVNRVAVQRWARRFGVLGEDGEPVKVHRARIRTTHQSMRDKSTWTGRARATIDPNHTPAVEGDHYLSATTPAQRHLVEAIVEGAQHDLLRRAHPPTVITEQDAAVLAAGYPQLAADLGLDDTVIAELVGGTRDVFTAACGDQLSGLHGPAGKPCPARPWVCLLCPLAVVAPRHAVNLLRLKAFVSRQWRQMPAAQFMAVFGPYAGRIDQVLDRFDPAALASASALVANADDEIPLRPEELTA